MKVYSSVYRFGKNWSKGALTRLGSSRQSLGLNVNKTITRLNSHKAFTTVESSMQSLSYCFSRKPVDQKAKEANINNSP